jgi:hypothetical protein
LGTAVADAFTVGAADDEEVSFNGLDDSETFAAAVGLDFFFSGVFLLDIKNVASSSSDDSICNCLSLLLVDDELVDFASAPGSSIAARC